MLRFSYGRRGRITGLLRGLISFRTVDGSIVFERRWEGSVKRIPYPFPLVVDFTVELY